MSCWILWTAVKYLTLSTVNLRVSIYKKDPNNLQVQMTRLFYERGMIFEQIFLIKWTTG